jgi:hypothetical protein
MNQKIFGIGQTCFSFCPTDLQALQVNMKRNFLILMESFSNGNASETKANESFDNSVFFYSEAKRTPSLESKLFSKRSEHIR